MKKLAHLIDFVIVTILMPILLSLVVYYGFFTNYTGGLFSEDSFRQQYAEGIYKYRFLGSELLLWLHDAIEQNTLLNYLFSRFTPRALNLFDVNGTTIFYGSYFLQNTFFLCLTTIILYFLFEQNLPEQLKSQKHILLLTAVLLMTITQYVVVPYDTLSYFFLVLAIFLSLRQSGGAYAILLLVLVLATMTRETAVFILTFYAAYHYKPLLAKNKTQLIKLAGLIATFMITYALLRILFSGENAIFQQIRLLRNLTNPSALASIVLFIVITYILINRTDNPSHCLLFLLLSVPYILMIITVANPWEIRLWTPIWLGLLILGRLYIPAYTQT